VLTFFAAQLVNAQTESSLYFMGSLPQVVYTNPASIPRYKFSLGLPGSSIQTQYANNGFTYNDLVAKQGDSTIVDMNKFHGALGEKNYITNTLQADVFRLSFKVNARMYFTFNATAKAYNRFMIPKGLVGLISEGTASFVGKTTTISPLIETVTYVESSWGASYIVNKKLTVGAHFKLLKGGANLTTGKSKLDLTIGDNYEVTVAADANVRTSGLQNFDEPDFDMADSWRDYMKNTGFAVDLGATYRVNDRTTIGLSLIDIGSIKWKNDLYGYRLDPERANYTFKGVDLEKVLDDDGDYMDNEMDSIEANFTLREGAISSYSTPIPGKAYLSGNYEIKRNFTAGILLFAEKFRGRFSPGFSASLHKEFGRRFSTSLSYTITERSYNNIGAGVALNLAPIQIYLVGDNLLRAPLALLSDNNLNAYVNSSKFINLRAGFNIVMGWDKTAEKLPAPKKKRL